MASAEHQEMGWLKRKETENEESEHAHREKKGKNGGRGESKEGVQFHPLLPLQTLRLSQPPSHNGPNSGRVKSCIALVTNYCFG